MDKSIQVYIIKSKIIKLLADMLEAEDTAIEKKTILEFTIMIQKFFNM